MTLLREIAAVQLEQGDMQPLYCIISINTVWHIGIALSFSSFVASVSSFVITLCIPDSISKMA